MKQVLVFGEGLGIGPLLVQLHADGVEAITASSAATARLALEDTHFDAAIGSLEDFLPGGALSSSRARRLAIIHRDQLSAARAVLGTQIDDCLLMPLRSEELLLALERRLAARSGQSSEFAVDPIIGIEGGLAKAWSVLTKAAGFDADVLITGESGTGKELFARSIHRLSKRANGPFVPINCAAIPEGLLESQLFGHVRGAFTDAQADRTGVFARASGGTLFLDEIGDVAPEVQVKLLRALQMREVHPVGGDRAVPIDVRVVSATSRDLPARIRDGLFRDDLYYRLAVVPLEVPALRERPEDLGPLIDHFLARFARKHELADLQLSPEGRVRLVSAFWPGNVRELENTIERLAVLAEDAVISAELIEREVGLTPADGAPASPNHEIASALPSALGARLRGRPLKEAMHAAEASFIAEALGQCAGKRSKCAELLDISQRALLYKIKEHNL